MSVILFFSFLFFPCVIFFYTYCLSIVGGILRTRISLPTTALFVIVVHMTNTKLKFKLKLNTITTNATDVDKQHMHEQ